MKNFSIIIVLMLSMAIFSSCKKKYTCVCEDGLVVNDYLDKLNKKEANVEKAKCEAAPTCTFQRAK